MPEYWWAEKTTHIHQVTHNKKSKAIQFIRAQNWSYLSACPQIENKMDKINTEKKLYYSENEQYTTLRNLDKTQEEIFE